MNDDITLMQGKWEKLMKILAEQFGKNLSLEGVVFLIGMRELGVGKREFTKEEKVDVMHIAICALLAPSGYYRLSHVDDQGWPHWIADKPLPHVDLFLQELYLKSHVVDYFSEIYDL
jgi:hypothetical protein